MGVTCIIMNFIMNFSIKTLFAFYLINTKAKNKSANIRSAILSQRLTEKFWENFFEEAANHAAVEFARKSVSFASLNLNKSKK